MDNQDKIFDKIKKASKKYFFLEESQAILYHQREEVLHREPSALTRVPDQT